MDEGPLGSDTAGNGTQSSPYATLLGAYTARNTSTINVHVRKPASIEEPTPSWSPASASGIKKAKKVFEQHSRKQAKKDESAKKSLDDASAKQESEARKLKESQAVIIQEPSEPALKIKLRQTIQHRGKRVKIFGWVHRLRQQGGLVFLVLRDGTGYMQCVLSGNLVSNAFSQFLVIGFDAV